MRRSKRVVLIACGPVRPEAWEVFARRARNCAWRLDATGFIVMSSFLAQGLPDPWRAGDRVMEIPDAYWGHFRDRGEYLDILVRNNERLYAFCDLTDPEQLDFLAEISLACEAGGSPFYLKGYR